MTRTLSVALILPAMFVDIRCINPFAPRLDVNLQAVLCNDLTKIDNVLCTFRNAYTFKDTTLYGTIFSSEFTFVYRDYDTGVDVSWGRDVEMRSTFVLFQNVQSLTLIWNAQIPIVESDTMYSVQRAFNLTVTFNPSDVERVDGNAILTFVRPSVNDAWKIVRWRDESNY